jgi:hypothetical protein
MNKEFKKIPFEVPEYGQHAHPSWTAWAPEAIDSAEWYAQFKSDVLAAVGKRFLPVVRLADGEFSFLFGETAANPRWPLWRRLRHNVIQFYRRHILRRNFVFKTRNACVSANYTQQEWAQARVQYAVNLKWISQKGYLAPQLAFFERPTMEQFQRDFFKWIADDRVDLNLSNLCQFYYVYALFLTDERPEIIEGNRVLVVHGAVDERKDKIIHALNVQGAKSFGWLSISNDRSLFDQLDVKEYIGQYDLVVLGAGVGKPHIIRQLEPLQIPVLDIGYVFEIWIDPECRFKRPFCCSDSFYDASKMRFHPTLRYIQDHS